jgi:diaminohydroxyphosphoribosylaminopyrimidine deaminase/5-amino-6-(5-phosphoribosylamino)uracil reductase
MLAPMADQQTLSDARFMDLALTLGRRGLGRTWPNPAVGAVIVAATPEGPRIVGRGWTQPGGRPHAEVEALRRAGDAARGATLYVTLEPCSHHGRSPPCADALIAAGIARVVSAIEDPNPLVAGSGHARLRAAGVNVEVGLGAAQALRDHAGHIRRVRGGRPHVMLKLAVSADEKVGLAGRRPARITGAAAQGRVHQMRAQYDAVLTGIGTALADDPLLTCRLPGMEARSPVRVVLDARLRLPLASKLVASAGDAPLWLVTSEGASANAETELKSRAVEALHAPAADGRFDLATVLRALAKRGITRLMVEAGPILAAAFLQADLVDEIALFRAPATIGPTGIDALEGTPLAALTASPRFVSLRREAVGDDTLEQFERKV